MRIRDLETKMEESIEHFTEVLTEGDLTEQTRAIVRTKINCTKWWLSNVRKLDARGRR